MKKVIALFGGIFLSLIAVLNVHAMTDTTIVEHSDFDVQSLNVDTDIKDEQLLPRTAISEIESDNYKENSQVWQQVVELHETETADRHTTYLKEQALLREAALEAVEEKEMEHESEVVSETYEEAAEETYEVTDSENAYVESEQPKQQVQTQQSQQVVQNKQPEQQVQNEQPQEQVQSQPPVQENTQPQQQQSGLNWSALAQCESGGNASIVSANGLYHGLYQFNVETWQAVGGSGLPSNASASEQTMRAQMLYDMRGSQPWPHCGGLLFS